MTATELYALPLRTDSLIKRCIRYAARASLRIDVLHMERWRTLPGALVVANHISLLDGPLLACLSPHPLTYAITATYARHPLWRRALDVLVRCKFGKYVTVDPTSPFGMKSILRALESGTGAVIFPEGKISRDGRLAGLQPGATLAAQRTGAIVLPIRIRGLEQPRRRESPLGHSRWLPRVTIEICQPIDPQGLSTEEIQARIRDALSGDPQQEGKR